MRGDLKLVRSCVPSARAISLIAAAIFFSMSGAGAQFLQEAKTVKFGAGCAERLVSKQIGLGACMIAEARVRVWCPNGKVYERDGTVPDISLMRSVCGLNQAP